MSTKNPLFDKAQRCMRAIDGFNNFSISLTTLRNLKDNHLSAEVELWLSLSYIVAADGYLSQKEYDFLSQVGLVSMGYDAYKNLLREHLNVLTDNNYVESIPNFLKASCEIENKYPRYTGLTQNIYSTFKELAYQLVACDEIDDTELGVFTKMTASYETYIKQHGIQLTDSSNISSNSSATPSSAHLTDHPNNDKSIEECLEELNALVGLSAVKQDINSLINLIKIRRIREAKGMRQPPMSLHLVFSGNPGTGKTTVARLLAQIYHKMGLLSKGHLVEADRSGLVAAYVGQTAIKTKEVVDKAMGGILFIDEAYTLSHSKSESDYGKEAIDTLLKCMEDNRDDFIVIVAGYPELMEEFLQSNPGLRSRFNKFIHFNDYTAEELLRIFEGLCEKNSFTLTPPAYEIASNAFITYAGNHGKDFANGRDVRNFFEKVMINQANRLAMMTDFSEEALTVITENDMYNVTIH